MKARLCGALLAALMLAACGTRLPDSAFEASSVRTDDGGTGEVTPGEELTPGDVTDTTLASGSGSSNGSSSAGASPAVTTAGGAKAASGPNQASDVGITATTITLGNITAENGVLGDAFAPAVRGVRAWTAAVNAAGGIGGRKIILKTCDDREDRARNLACAQQLVERDKVFAMVGNNTRAHGGSAEYLNNAAVPVIGIPITNAFNRYPHFWSAYPQGYKRDGKAVGNNGQLMATTGIYRWFKTHMGVTKAAVFQYDISESKQAGDSFAKGLQLEGMTASTYTVSFAAPSFDQAVADMQNKGVEIIIDAMDDGANRKLCDAMQRRGFKVKAKVSTIVSMGDSVGNDYNATCRDSVYIPGQSIPYSSTGIPEVAKFRAAFAKYQPGQEIHQWALETWGLANMVAEGIKLGGASPTRKGLESFLTSLRKYRANGLFVGLEWGNGEYEKSKVEDCFTVAHFDPAKNQWVEATDKFPFCYPDAFQYGAPALEQGN
jgi:ABC-type branched-subunit amino acid transport system substrate-binding protein